MSACPVCWTLGGTGKRAILIMFLCSIFLWPVGHVLKRQKNGPFQLSRLPVLDGTGRRAIFKVLSAYPVCAHGSLFRLSRHILVRPQVTRG